MIKEHLCLILTLSILLLPVSCRTRPASSSIQNVNLEKTDGFDSLSEPVKRNALAIQKYLNQSLRSSDWGFYDVKTDKKMPDSEFSKVSDTSSIYFKNKNMENANFGLQFFPKFEEDSLKIKVQALSLSSTKEVIPNTEQVIDFRYDKLEAMFDRKSPDDMTTYSDLSVIRERISSTVNAAYNYAITNHQVSSSERSKTVFVITHGAILAFAGFSTLILPGLPVSFKTAKKIFFTAMLVCTVVGVLGMYYIVADSLKSTELEKSAAEVPDQFLPENWERNFFILE